MTYTDELYDYIEAHISAEPEGLHQLERISNLRMVHGRMCSGHWQGRLLKMLTEMIRPSRVLELGTFTGYATLCIAEGMAACGIAESAEANCRGTIDTIEIFDENEDFLRDVFARFPEGERINLIIGDALEILPALDRSGYDLIFIDADKRFYPEYLRLCKPLLTPGGYIIADNTLWDGHVTDPARHDPQTLGVRRFNELVAADSELESVIVPLRDGLTLIRMRREPGAKKG
ncbi:MAG: O-methyltransferase [Muribaculaceae bacterium]|nr:O-methyltransferase [Muribaculaceae bacterium]